MSKDFDPYYQWLGIPPAEQPADFYRLLGVQRFESDADVISNAADRQMAYVRTFQQGKHSDVSQRILNEVSTAKVCLLNPGKKQDYDAQLKLKLAAASQTPASGPGGPPVARPVGSASGVFTQSGVFRASGVYGPPTPGAAGAPNGAGASSIGLMPGMTPSPMMAPPPGMAPAPPFDPYAGAPAAARPVAAATVVARVAAPAPASGSGESAPLVFEDPDAHGSSILARRAAAGPSPALVGGVAAGVLAVVALLYFAGVFGGAAVVNRSHEHNTGEPTGSATPVATSAGTPVSTPEPTAAIPATTPEATTSRPPNNFVAPTNPNGSGNGNTPPGNNGPNGSRPAGPNNGPRTNTGVPLQFVSFDALLKRSSFDSPVDHDYAPQIGYRSVWPSARVCRDMQREIDPEQWAATGSWRREGDALVSSTARPAMLELPFPHFPARRMLTLVVERVSGDDGFAIGVPMGPTAAIVVLGSDGNARSGLGMVDGRTLREGNGTERIDQDVFPVGTPRIVQINWTDYWVQAVCHSPPDSPDRKSFVINWSDGLHRLGPSPVWRTNDPSRAFLASYNSSFKVSKIEFLEEHFVGSKPLVPSPAYVEDMTVSPEPEDVVAGVWKPQGDALSLLESEGRSRVQLPVEPNSGYQLKATFQRLPVAGEAADSRTIAFGLPIAGRQVMLALESPEGTGFTLVDGKFLAGPGRPTFDEGPHAVSIQVRENTPGAAHRFRVTADVDGRRVAEWDGDAPSLETPANWISHDPKRIWLGADSPVKFSSVTVARIDARSGQIADGPLNKRRSSVASGGANPNAVASNDPPGNRNPPGGANNPSNTNNNGAPGGVFAPRAKRPKPDDAALAAARKTVEELFAREIAGAKTAEDKAVLAHTLLGAIRDAAGDAASTYALLEAARQWGAEGGDAEAVTKALEGLDEQFEIDRWPLTQTTFETAAAAAKTPESRAALARALAPLVNAALDAERVETAAGLATIGKDAATKSRDVELRKTFNELAEQTAAVAEQTKAAEQARATLAQNPDDGDANAALGKYLCFVKQDWEAGLPHLAKAKDDALRAVADREKTPPQDGDGAAALADAWWDLGKAAAKADKANFQVRAQHWYQFAKGKLTGPAARKVEKRLEEIAGLNLGAAGGRKSGKVAALPQGAEPGMLGQLTILDRPVALVKYQPGGTVTFPGFGPLAQMPRVVDNAQARVQIDGFLRMNTGGRVSVRHFCSSSSGCSTELYVNGRLVNREGDDLSKDETTAIDLPAGEHLVRWEIRGFLRGIGEAGVAFTDAAGRPVPVYYAGDTLKQIKTAAPNMPELEVGR